MTVTASLSNRKKMDSSPPSILPRLIGFAILILVDAFFIWFISKLIPLGFYPLAAAITVIAIFVNVVVLRKEAYPLRWMMVGLVLMALFTIYPIIFTVWVYLRTMAKGI
jgi:hypothetical protein